ncbi:MAG: phosphatidate cytidylyltransferase [Alphaproteobacteria bacterium]|nr:phosphatidate cytidylyltransferase [Alphaproteobacteria bacterium]
MASKLQKRIISALIIGPLSLLVFWIGGWPFLALVGIAFAISVHEWLNLSRKTFYFERYAAAGLIYFMLCFYSFIAMRMQFDQGFFLVMSFATTVWAGDVGAYFAGKFIGGAKLMPSISPNKTWAGLIGGMLFSGLFMFVLYGVAPLFELRLPFSSMFIAFFVGMALTIVGQAGDLLISAAKRRASIKDTSNLIPGHGGLLDRIDSLMMGALFFFIVVSLSGAA